MGFDSQSLQERSPNVAVLCSSCGAGITVAADETP